MEQEYHGNDYYTVRDAWRTDQWATIQGFTVANNVAKKAVALVSDQRARGWQTKEGTYRIKKQLDLPDVHDAAGDVDMGDL